MAGGRRCEGYEGVAELSSAVKGMQEEEDKGMAAGAL